MGNHFIVFPKHQLVLASILLFWVVCTAQEEESAFIDCMSRKSQASKIDSFVHPSGSPAYSNIIQNCQRNGRWLNSTSSRPLVIVTPNAEAEVPAIIMCSQESGLQVRIKSGGHDYEGLSYRAENLFVMIDLRNLNKIDINLEEENAWVQTGVALGELYYAISQKSNVHAFPAGMHPTVGTGGHISGGGHGTLLRKYGLAADNVIDARLVDAYGRILDRSTMGEDLFWALKGGGGSSFGVVLAWKLKLVRVPKKVVVFTVRRKFDASEYALLQKWQKISHTLPEELFTRILIQNRMQGKERVLQLSYQGMFQGNAFEFVRLMKQTFPEFGLEVNDCLGDQPPSIRQPCNTFPCVKKECYQVPWIKSAIYYADKKVNVSASYLIEATKMPTPASYYKGKSDYLNRPIPDEGFDMIRKEFVQEDFPIMIIASYGGKMSQIAEDATPFPHRGGVTHNVQYLDYSKTNEEGEVNRHLEWMKSFYKKMEPYVTSSPRQAYINYKDLDLGRNKLNSFKYADAKQWGECYFKGNFERLAKIKTMVDHKNFFRNDQSIPPLS